MGDKMFTEAQVSLIIAVLVFSTGLLILVDIGFRIFVSLNRDITKSAVKKRVRGYKLFYSDQRETARDDGVVYSKLLSCEKHQLTGKPDLIYRSTKGDMLMPVELKSGAIGFSDIPHEGDLMQLAAYFLIIEDCFGLRPKFGRIVYSDHMFVVKNTKKLEKELLNTLSNMREMLVTGEQDNNCSFVTCRYCMCSEVCEWVGNN